MNQARYEKYSRIIHQMLADPRYFADDIEKIREVFNSNLLEMLKIAIDYSFDADALALLTVEMSKSTNINTSIDAVERYLETSMENEDVYAILNRYYLTAILSFVKHAPKESLTKIDALFDQYEFDKNDIIEVDKEWRKVQDTDLSNHYNV